MPFLYFFLSCVIFLLARTRVLAGSLLVSCGSKGVEMEKGPPLGVSLSLSLILLGRFFFFFPWKMFFPCRGASFLLLMRALRRSETSTQHGVSQAGVLFRRREKRKRRLSLAPILLRIFSLGSTATISLRKAHTDTAQH